ncbi:MAG: amidohydrolase family protein [Clostridiales bacterium]|nr:amidohydrolase family protein [Clostridiales bacterium]
MKLYDLENHFYDLATVEALANRKGYPYYDKTHKVIRWTEQITMAFDAIHDKLVDVGEGRLATMDRVGITTAVISPSQALEELDPSESVGLTKKNNDTVYEMTQRYPGRYLGSAALPVKDVSAACKELERCVRELGFVCWHTHSNYTDAAANDERFVPIFETAAELGVYVYLHPTLPTYNGQIYAGLGDFDFTLAGPGAGFTVDTMLTTLKLIASGLFDRVPKTKLVIGHFGEAIPFLLDRIDNRLSFMPNPKLRNQRKPSDYFRDNIYVTTSGNMSAAAFRCTRDVLGIEKIIFGSDYPYEGIDAMTDFVKNLELTEEERELLFFKNAEKLLKI